MTAKKNPLARLGRLLLISIAALAAVPVLGNPLDGQIIVDPSNPAWLKYHNGGPHFLAAIGDPEDFLYRGSRNSNGTRNGDQATIIANLRDAGANGIYFQAVRSHGGDGNSNHNPFVDSNPANGLDNAILDQWETWFTDLEANGTAIYFFFYDDSASIWNTGDQVGAAETQFLQSIVNRFEHHKNIVWVIAEEYAEAFSPTRVSNIAAVIRNADDHDHVISVHKNVGNSFSEFANDPNIDQFAMQIEGNAQSIHDSIVSAWNQASGRFNLNMSESPSWGTGFEARKKAWSVAMAGAYVMVLFWDGVTTPPNDLRDLGRLADFMESTRFNEMAPSDNLALGGAEYVLASGSDLYIAYASNRNGADLGVRGTATGTYDFTWYDIANDETVSEPGIAVSGGDLTRTPPDGFGSEVAVYIEKTNGTTPPAPQVTFPGATWEFRSPASVGLDSAKLDEFASNLSGNGCIVRYGYMVKCWGNSSANADWASAAKPVLGTLLFFAIDEGTVGGVDEQIGLWNWNMSAKDQSMTFRHLANMMSGYARGEAPGAAWAYNDIAISLYAKTLERVFGSSLDNAALSRMAALRFEDDTIFGSRSGNGVRASVRDFARIGWLWLNKGAWNGQQLISRDHFDRHLQPAVPGSTPRTTSGGSDYLGVGSYGGDSNQTPYGPGIYGFNWWFNGTVGNGSSVNWPDAPPGTFQANGHWGFEVVTVIPSLDMVVAAQGNWGDFTPGDSSSAMNRNLKLLVDAVIGSAASVPAQPSGLVVE